MIEFIFALNLFSADPSIKFQADTSKYQLETKKIELIGNVEVTRTATQTESEVVLKSDTVHGKIDGEIFAEGRVKLNYRGVTVNANHGVYDFGTAEGRFEEANFVYDSWYVKAAVLRVVRTEQFYIDKVTATACDYNPPHYHFKLSKASYDGTHLRLSSATMYIGKIPVFWLPYLSLRPAGGKPPFRIRIGKSDYEGYFVKTAYLYSIGKRIGGEIKVDWRSHRGWGYGIENRIELKRGFLDLDLYRMDERDRRARGVARAKYRQELMNRLTARAHIYYVTDGNFLQDYRFESFASEPDPLSSASLSLRKDAWAGILRVDVNQQRKGYTLIERIPELRWGIFPRKTIANLHIESYGGFTVFRHNYPYDSGAAALNRRDNPTPSNGMTLTRGDASVIVRRPFNIGEGFTFTPEARIEALAYVDDTGIIKEPYRIMQSIGASFGTVRRFQFSNTLQYSIRPVAEFLERGPGWRKGDINSIIEHIDRTKDARILRLVLDQDLFSKRSGAWRESIRLRIDGGFDFDRIGSEKYLPITGKLSLWPIANSKVDAGISYEPERSHLRDAWIDFYYSTPGISASAGYVFRKGLAGLKDNANANAGIDARITRYWQGGVNMSYNLTENRMDYAQYRLGREFHDWIIRISVTDQKVVNRWDFRISADMKFP